MGSKQESTKIYDILKKRDELLRERPELREMQDKIDALLSTTQPGEDRCRLLLIMMQDKIAVLKSKWDEIGTICRDVLDKEAKLGDKK